MTNQEFDKIHGDYIVDETKTWAYYEDGAIREISAFGVQQQPPLDPHERAKRIVYFFEKKLELVSEEFRFIKQQLLSKAKMNLTQKNPSFPDKDGPKHLKELQQKVHNYQRKLEQAKETLENLKPKEISDLERTNAEARAEIAELIAELDKIEV